MKKLEKKKLPSELGDAIRSLFVCLIPRSVCTWLWHEEVIPLGHWAPHILGRMLGSNVQRVKPKK